MLKTLNDYLKKHSYIINAYGNFEIKEQLGQGGTSIVRKVIFENKEEYAIKFLLENIQQKESKAFKRFKQAHLNLLKIQSTGVILPQIHFDILNVSESVSIPYIIMSKADKTLYELKKETKIEYELFEKILKSLIIILKIIHENGIIHRDVKPENIFILNKKIVLGDFDIAKFDEKIYLKLQETKPNERLANYFFSAPEQSSKNFDEITESADLYALGQVLYWLLNGKTLRGQSKINLDKRFKKYEPLLEKLLQDDISHRFKNINEVEKFMTDYDNKQKSNEEKNEKIKAQEEFDKIINKYTLDLYFMKFKHFTDIKNINNIMYDLSNNFVKLNLWWTQGYRNYSIPHIKKYKSLSYFERLKDILTKNTKWILGDFEVDIKSIWIYKYGEIGGSFLIIESKPMKSFGINNSNCDEEWVAIYKNRYIPISHIDNGWTEYKGKKIKIEKYCEARKRYKYPTIFFVAPFSSSIINPENDKIINYIYEKYTKDNSELNEKLLEHLKRLKRRDIFTL